MSQPPYGVPPQHGAPQGQPGQPPPPAYLGGGAPVQGGPPPAYGGPGGQFGGAGLSGLAPPSKPRSIGLVMGLVTTFGMIAFVLIVAIITLNN